MTPITRFNGSIPCHGWQTFATYSTITRLYKTQLFKNLAVPQLAKSFPKVIPPMALLKVEPLWASHCKMFSLYPMESVAGCAEASKEWPGCCWLLEGSFELMELRSELRLSSCQSHPLVTPMIRSRMSETGLETGYPSPEIRMTLKQPKMTSHKSFIYESLL